MPTMGRNAIKLVANFKQFGVQPGSFGIWYDSGSTVPSSAGLSTLITGGGAWATQWVTLLAQLKIFLNPNSSYEGLSAFGYNVAGALVAQAFAPVHTVGTGSSNSFPQVALVASLRTASFGRSYRGRIYLPIDGVLPGADGQVTSATCTAAANAVAAFLTATSAGGPPTASVGSFTKSLMTPINSVIVDSVADTQRRRRDQFVSLHTAQHAV
jgi:hypothetical protein